MTRGCLLGLVGCCTLLGPSAAMAQACAGFRSYEGAPVRLDASASVRKQATTLGASLSAGAGIFGVVTAGVTQYQFPLGRSTDLNLAAGYDIVVKGGPRIAVCPVVEGVAVFRAADRLVGDSDHRIIGGAVGLAMSAAVMRFRRLAVVPSWGFRAHRARVTPTRTPEFAVTAKGYVATFDVGIVVDDWFTFRPGLVLTKRRDSSVQIHGGDVAARVTLGVSFGRRPDRSSTSLGH